MQVQTKAYGRIEVDERQKIYFPSGLLGFENLKDYLLLDAAQQPFYWLQSLDVPELAFVMINPTIFRRNYLPGVLASELKEIDLIEDNPESSLVFAIVTIPEEHSKMTANLQGPIIINREKRIGRQCISITPDFMTQHYVLEELAALKDGVC
ncbi:MAG: flagellar assembly protein FliW [Spirochaetales bacterium]|nr:flagellar assembly protein FliW [Spirochaetales bacterium]